MEKHSGCGAEQNAAQDAPTMRIPEQTEKTAAAAPQDTGYGAYQQPTYIPEPPPSPEDDAPEEPPRRRMGTAAKRIVAMLAAVVVLFGAAYFIHHAVVTPEKTVQRFLAALETQSVSDLLACASSADAELPLNAAASEALFALYADSSSFRSELSGLLEEQAISLQKRKTVGDSAHELVRLTKKNKLGFTGYEVLLQPCRLRVSIRYPGEEITVAGQTLRAPGSSTGLPRSIAAYDSVCVDAETTNGTVTFDRVLPGSYEMVQSYTNALGDTFCTTKRIGVDARNDYETTDAYRDAAFLLVRNDSSGAITLHANGKTLCEMECSASLWLELLPTGTILKAKAVSTPADTSHDYEKTADWGEAVATVTAGESERFSVAFSAITVENPCEQDILVSVDGMQVGKLHPGGSWKMSPMLPGMQITLTLDAAGRSFPPITYTVNGSDDDLLRPNFGLQRIDLSNYFRAPIVVYVNDEEVRTLDARSDGWIYAAQGDEVKLVLRAAPYVPPYSETVGEHTNYISPDFALDEAANTEIEAFLNAYVMEAFRAYAAGDIAALRNHQKSDLTEELEEMLEEEAEQIESFGYRRWHKSLALLDAKLASATLGTDDGQVTVSVSLKLHYDEKIDYLEADGSPYRSDAYPDSVYTLYAILRQEDGAWLIQD